MASLPATSGPAAPVFAQPAPVTPHPPSPAPTLQQEVIFPLCALGATATRTFRVHSHGVVHLRLRARVVVTALSGCADARAPSAATAAASAAACLSISFPEGDTLSLARPTLLLRLDFASRAPIGLEALVELAGGGGEGSGESGGGGGEGSGEGEGEGGDAACARVAMPVCAAADDCALSLRRRHAGGAAATATAAAAAAATASGNAGDACAQHRRAAVALATSLLFRRPLSRFPAEVIEAAGAPMREALAALSGAGTGAGAGAALREERMPRAAQQQQQRGGRATTPGNGAPSMGRLRSLLLQVRRKRWRETRGWGGEGRGLSPPSPQAALRAPHTHSPTILHPHAHIHLRAATHRHTHTHTHTHTQTHSQHASMLRWLTAAGALLCHVRPGHLLSLGDWARAVRAPARYAPALQGPRAPLLLARTPLARLQAVQARVAEHAELSLEAWEAVALQVRKGRGVRGQAVQSRAEQSESGADTTQPLAEP